MKSLSTILLCLTLGVVPNAALRKLTSSQTVSRSRIIGGQTAQTGQYPWIAAIYITKPDGQYFCAGSVFNEEWILTAAQCVIDGTAFKVQVGSNLLTGDDPNRVTLSSTTSFYEPRFNFSHMRHDIGLIKLSSALTFNDYIQPIITLGWAMSPLYQGVPAEIAGWGQTADTGDLIEELGRVDVTVQGQEECRVFIGDQLFGSMICTMGSSSNEGPCIGDMGTPLMIAAPVGDHTIATAVASFVTANGCESTDPAGYSRIDAYYGWIHDTTENN